jgi:UDP:flavonoid glycosyltransferase YjiC (YdhE family)
MAGAIAAEAAGIPHADHSFGVIRPLALTRAAADVLAPISRELGVRNPGVGGNGGELYLDICPPSLQLPDIAEIPNRRALRPVGFDAAPDARLPDWLHELPDRPVVYATMGTVFNEAEAVFRTILEALRDEPIELVLTVGNQGDPAAFGEQRANVHIERYIPQSQLLERCDVFVSHAGSGAILGALNAAVPMLALPQGADQFVNADRISHVGAGLKLAPHEATVEAIRGAVRRLLADRTYAERAGAVREEIQEMPAQAEIVPVLEEFGRGLAAGRQVLARARARPSRIRSSPYSNSSS